MFDMLTMPVFCNDFFYECNAPFVCLMQFYQSFGKVCFVDIWAHHRHKHIVHLE